MNAPDISPLTVTVPTLWDSRKVAEYLSLSVAWLERDRASGEPKIPYIKFDRSVRYRAIDVIKALEALSVGDAA